MFKTISQLRFGLSIFSVLLFTFTTAHAGEGEVLGRYWLPDHDGQFDVYVKDDRFYGRVISYDVVGQRDEENDDPALRGRPFVGIDMFAAFRFDESETRWIDGTIYDPKSGKTYDCVLWFDDGKPDVLMARGFIGFAFLGRNERFDRVLPTLNAGLLGKKEGLHAVEPRER